MQKEAPAAGTKQYPVVMDVPMVAEMLLSEPNQIRRWANSGLIPCHRVPGTRRYRFMRDEVLAWLAGLPGTGVPEEERTEAST